MAILRNFPYHRLLRWAVVRAAARGVVCRFGARQPARALFAAQEAANGMPDNLQRSSGIELVFFTLDVSNELA